MDRLETTLLEKKTIANNVLELRFAKPEGFDYTPSQFVQFYIPGEEKETLRSYSLASLPSDEYIEFCVKLLPNGIASEYFKTMPEGATIAFRGPRGRFVTESTTDGHYFVATGAGIAPMMGMFRQLIDEKTDQPIRLLFGVRDLEDIIWEDRLEAMKASYPLFDYNITLSQPKPTGGWKGLHGRVTEHLLHTLGKERYYLCGSAAMVKDVRSILIENGVEAKAIHFEIF